MIECRNLTHDYGDFRAVDAVSFEVRKGAICALLGPNGAGKSTIMKMLAGLLTPGAGSVAVTTAPSGGAPIVRSVAGAPTVVTGNAAVGAVGLPTTAVPAVAGPKTASRAAAQGSDVWSVGLSSPGRRGPTGPGARCARPARGSCPGWRSGVRVPGTVPTSRLTR